MKMKKLLAVLLAALMMLTLFAGCGDKSSDDGKKDDTVNSESADKDTEKKEPDNSGDTIDIRPGKINGNTYTNTSVGITFTKPDDWEFSYINTPEDETDFYKDLVSSHGVADMEITFPDGSLSVGFQDLSAADLENTTEEDFLAEIKEIWSDFETSEIYKKTISNHTYSAVDVTVESNGAVVNQRLYVRKEGKYVITISMTSTSDIDFDSFEKLFS